MTVVARGADAELLERDESLSILDGLLAGVRSGSGGRLLLVGGEAGVGKTALLRRFCEEAGKPVRILWGACEPLRTPRPLGPLVDIADAVSGELEELLSGSATPHQVAMALLEELDHRVPAVVVLEDLHWADEATLDVLTLLTARIRSVPAVVLASYRDDEVDRSEQLRLVLGELVRRPGRLKVAPLSAAAVEELAATHGVDGGELFRRTGGNPFYVTEVLEAPGEQIPETVRDAVLARAARLSVEARTLLDAVAIVPGQVGVSLLEALAGEVLDRLEECIALGILRAERDRVAFRHEIARVAIEDALPPDRAVALHRAALCALSAAGPATTDLALVAHHAEGAGDIEAVLRYAPMAAERAASVGAHREAAAQLARALRFADALDGEQRADLFERRSYECYLTGAFEDAIAARQSALAEHQARGDRMREGDTRRWLSRLAWFAGDNLTAAVEAEKAVQLLAALPPGRELAMAQSNMAQLRTLSYDVVGARVWGARAIELAEKLAETEILIHSLNNVGAAEMLAGAKVEGREKLERSLALALVEGLDEHVARAHTNLACCGIDLRDYELGDHHLDEGMAYCRERDLDSWLLYMTGWRARSELEQGRWDEASTWALTVLDRLAVSAPTRITPLAVLGRLRARRGDPDVWGPLDEASELAKATGELQRLLPVALARAEARWLAGDAQRVDEETGPTLELAVARQSSWGVGELLVWRRRAGITDSEPSVRVAEPLRLELAGDSTAASTLWCELGCPYEAALALAGSGDEAALRQGLDELQAFGARPAAAIVARRLRERGVRGLPRGPRPRTRENPAGLTARELEVLALVAEGLRNAQIAERLVVSGKTVDHHVSAILRKLDVRTRGEAAAEANRLGLTRPA
jgi:DNA-binding CsgD family transcriptional regulator